MDITFPIPQHSEKMEQQTRYLSFLLRLWRMPHGETTRLHGSDSCNGLDSPGWLASIEEPYTGERIGFGCLDDLFDFLRAQAGLASEASEDQE